jgi:hypothetical protein
MQFTLEQYPAAIAQAVQSVTQINQQIVQVRLKLDRIEENAEIAVSFDVTLKNDRQRDARRFEMLQASADYETYTKSLIRLKCDQSNAEAMLEQLRNGFSAAMLLIQMQIADRGAMTIPHRTND